ncbi:hypothetical protein PR202_ga02909 [Eleusine coracana subsp. coracana]|uniref:Uncharacterized protein n=1 Tax=Eleusine coracana subsp. coracana TaxID=191504 RepID=A0AAV5BKQ1_ELECO|nr:hypothetical protein PR202_ga02909 [Eleusine coracana subsp. coracana]
MPVVGINSDKVPTSHASNAERRRGGVTGVALAPMMTVAPKSMRWNAEMRNSGLRRSAGAGAGSRCDGSGVGSSLVRLPCSSFRAILGSHARPVTVTTDKG